MTAPSVLDVASGVLGAMTRKGELLEPVRATIMTACSEDAVTVVYTAQDEFTIATIQNRVTHTLLGTGVSKRNPVDKWNGTRGRATALSRAVRNWVDMVNSTSAGQLH